MRALVFHGPWQLAVEDRPDPEPGDGETLLEIIATGICGSDLHGYTGENGRRHPGQVMGHETVGRVVVDRTGRLASGTIATINPVLGCGACPACAAGSPQRCPQRRVIGVQPEISSAFAQRMVAPSRNVIPLPLGTAPDIGALVEPLAVGYHSLQRAAVRPDDSVYVIGGGPIGQAVAIAAGRLGASTVVIAELDTARRALIGRLGFTAIDPAAESSDGIRALLGGPATVVVDAVGTTRTLEIALEVSAVGARIVLVGLGVPRVELAAYAVSTAERSILGSFAYADADFSGTAQWAADHAAVLEPLIEKRVGLEEAPNAFRALADGSLSASKVLVCPWGT